MGVPVTEGVGVDVAPVTVPVMVIPVDETSALVVLPIAATVVVLANCIEDCFAARILTFHVPIIPAPFNGLDGCTPSVVVIVPLACVSGTSTIGSGVPGVKLTICMAVGS